MRTRSSGITTRIRHSRLEPDVPIERRSRDSPRLADRADHRACHIRRCLLQPVFAVIGRNSRSVTASRPRSVGGRNRISSWMPGARSSRFIICVTRARLTCPILANSAWSAHDAVANQLVEANGQRHEPGDAGDAARGRLVSAGSCMSRLPPSPSLPESHFSLDRDHAASSSLADNSAASVLMPLSRNVIATLPAWPS